MRAWFVRHCGAAWRTSIALAKLDGGTALGWYLKGYNARVAAAERHDLEEILEAIDG
jgi:hypothetical protein